MGVGPNPILLDLRDPTGQQIVRSGRLEQYLPIAGGTMRGTIFLDGHSIEGGVFTQLTVGQGSDLSILSGAITVTHSYHKIDTQQQDATDDLDTINGAAAVGAILVIRAVNSARTVVAKDNTGNLQLAGDFSLDNTTDTLTLIWDGTDWIELSRSDNGA